MADIEAEVLQKLKCSLCQCYLSFSPIMQKANGDSVCGRCVTADNVEHSTTLRMKEYEALASTHTFPCRYDKDGCRTKLRWQDGREHETDCSYRPYECFMLPPGSCTWTGCRNQLMKHFTDAHPKNIMKISHDTEIDVSQDFEMNILTTVFDMLFLVQIKLSKIANKMWHTVRYIGNEKCSKLFKYSFTVISEEEDTSKKRKVEPANSLYTTNDKSHEIDFEIFLECLTVAVKVNIDRKFAPSIETLKQCTLCKKSLNLYYTRQTKDGCYCTECAPDNYVLIGSSPAPLTVRCERCTVAESVEGIQRHAKWLCTKSKIYCSRLCRCDNNLHHIAITNDGFIKAIDGLTWESLISVQFPNRLMLRGKLRGLFFIFTDLRDTELLVQIVSDIQANEVELFECKIKVSNPATNYSVQTIAKKGKDCDWESHFNWTPKNSFIEKYIENGKFRSRFCLKVTIKRVD